jgi:hypothetical protein
MIHDTFYKYDKLFNINLANIYLLFCIDYFQHKIHPDIYLYIDYLIGTMNLYI